MADVARSNENVSSCGSAFRYRPRAANISKLIFGLPKFGWSGMKLFNGLLALIWSGSRMLTEERLDPSGAAHLPQVAMGDSTRNRLSLERPLWFECG